MVRSYVLQLVIHSKCIPWILVLVANDNVDRTAFYKTACLQ